MKAGDMLDEIEQICASKGIAIPGDRWVLLQWLSSELTALTGKRQWDWALVHLDPIVVCVIGQKNYALPENFPNNFVRFADDSGDKWLCKLDDGYTQSFLEYKDPVQFYSQDQTSVSNSIPASYTVVSTPAGRREIILYPPPDDEYQIDGLYQPTDWSIDEMDALPVIPGNCAVLKYGVLRRLNKAEWDQDYQDAYANLCVETARAHSSRLMANKTFGQGYDVFDAYGGR